MGGSCPPRVTVRRVAVSLRGPGQSPGLPFACCVVSPLSAPPLPWGTECSEVPKNIFGAIGRSNTKEKRSPANTNCHTAFHDGVPSLFRKSLKAQRPQRSCIPCSAVVNSVCLLHFGSLYHSNGIHVHEVEEASGSLSMVRVGCLQSQACDGVGDAIACHGCTEHKAGNYLHQLHQSKNLAQFFKMGVGGWCPRHPLLC